MNIAIYIKGERLDLFDDETIEITSKLNDIEKLSNVFTDFSQSFTIPATAKNNNVFKHYYDLNIDNTFNANIRVESYFEIDTIPFKLGVIQLESVNVKYNQPETYKITFYGGLRQLTDIFGEDLIADLDYVTDEFGVKTKEFTSLSQFDYDYTSTNFISSINDPSFQDGNVMTPLILLREKDVGVLTTDINFDITKNEGVIIQNELRPSLRIINLINAIETKYDISFSRDFFQLDIFQNIFMWMNNKPSIEAEKQEIVVSSPFTGTPDIGNISIDSDGYINIIREKYHTSLANKYRANLIVDLTVSDQTIPYNIYLVYENGELVTERLNVVGDSSFAYIWDSELNLFTSELVTEKVKILVQPTFELTITTNINFRYSIGFPIATLLTDVDSNGNVNIVSIDLKTNLNLPNLKVIDFLTGIMKMFKLIIQPTSFNTFNIQTIDQFYSKGNILNTNEFIDIENINFQRPLVYKDIKFKFQETENVTGKKFRENNKIGYGDLRALYPQVQGDELEVELPFENMLFENLTYQSGINIGEVTNIVIGQSSTLSGDTLSINNSGPILFYNTGIIQTTIPFKVKYNTTIGDISAYQLALNIDDQIGSQIKQSLNWGVENDPFLRTGIVNSLYRNFWDNWINTIYSGQQRKITMKAMLPVRLIQELSLNDRLIYNGNRLKIESYKVNLLTNQVDLVCFKDIFTNQPLPDTVDMTPIIMNSGSKYFSIQINNVQTEWVANFEWLTAEEDWIEFIGLNQGEESGFLHFRILEKVQQSPPLVYQDRTATLTIEVDGVDYEINITQLGLEE